MDSENSNNNIDKELELARLEIEKLELEKELKLRSKATKINEIKSNTIEEPKYQPQEDTQDEFEYLEKKKKNTQIYILSGLVLFTIIGIVFFRYTHKTNSSSSISNTVTIDSASLDSITVDTAAIDTVAGDEIPVTETTSNFYGTREADFLFDNKNLRELESKYESKDYKVEDAYDMENNIIGKQIVLFTNTINELFIVSKDMDSKIDYITFRKEDSVWVPPYNLHVGTTLERLLEMNEKDILIAGFETDNSGIVNWNGGKLEGKGIFIILQPSVNTSDSNIYNKYKQVMGDERFSSNNEIIKSLELVVQEASFSKPTE